MKQYNGQPVEHNTFTLTAGVAIETMSPLNSESLNIYTFTLTAGVAIETSINSSGNCSNVKYLHINCRSGN